MLFAPLIKNRVPISAKLHPAQNGHSNCQMGTAQCLHALLAFIAKLTPAHASGVTTAVLSVKGPRAINVLSVLLTNTSSLKRAKVFVKIKAKVKSHSDCLYQTKPYN